MSERLEPSPFELEAGGVRLAGEEVGEGRGVILAHGVTATRRYVVHGSVALARRGLRLVSYDARGHGSSAPAPKGGGYRYPELAADLAAIVAEHGRGEPPVLAGHSMGAHTAVHLALSGEIELGGLVLICPASVGAPPPQEELAPWDRLADGLERGGVEGFLKAYDADLGVDQRWRETLLRIARERLQRHRHPAAVAAALRQVPRSSPFEGLGELEFLGLPTLVVASHDEADPGHPYAVAEAWADRISGAELVSEKPGESPLAWQGGRLSRLIADFIEREA